MEASVEYEMNQTQMRKPHVVVLGAGASYAAFPNGDKNGKRLPLMNNLVDVLGLNDLLTKTGLTFDERNFEAVYDKIAREQRLQPIKEQLEQRIFGYFSSLEIPDTPTIYDHLLLSLRGKDAVATFNWDPFLYQAFERNKHKLPLPKIFFLHGNVEVGFCQADKIAGRNGTRCRKCGNPLIPSKLLYPIAEKNYESDEFISAHWHHLGTRLKDAFMISVFGYGAPTSDASAVALMKGAWGAVGQRSMEQTEIIDTRDEDTLQATWDPFIHSHHYEVHDNFYNSWIANHPRRTGEAFVNQYIEAMFINRNPIPKDLDFPALWGWFDRLHKVEKARGS